jgi:TonB family protein
VTLSLDDRRLQGWLLSALFHTMLLVLFLMIGIKLRTLPSEYSEVILYDLSASQASFSELVNAGVPVTSAPEQIESSTTVALPERRPVRLPSDEVIPVTSRQEADLPRVEPSRVIDQLRRSGQERPEITPGTTAGDRLLPPSTGLPEGLVLPDPTAAGGTGRTESPWQIQWIGQNREVVRSVLPEYPEGIQREVQLQFRFAVTPAGEVTGITPLQKGDPALEEAALTALRQWKFQPLPAASPQSNQEAVITLRFRIRF